MAERHPILPPCHRRTYYLSFSREKDRKKKKARQEENRKNASSCSKRNFNELHLLEREKGEERIHGNNFVGDVQEHHRLSSLARAYGSANFPPWSTQDCSAPAISDFINGFWLKGRPLEGGGWEGQPVSGRRWRMDEYDDEEESSHSGRSLWRRLCMTATKLNPSSPPRRPLE